MADHDDPDADLLEEARSNAQSQMSGTVAAATTEQEQQAQAQELELDTAAAASAPAAQPPHARGSSVSSSASLSRPQSVARTASVGAGAGAMQVHAVQRVASLTQQQQQQQQHQRRQSGATPLTLALSTGPANTTTTTTNASVTYNTTNINVVASSPSPVHANGGGGSASTLAALMAGGGGGSDAMQPAMPSGPATLASFQAHALSSVHGLATSFGQIASVLANDQAHTAQEEENVRRQLAALQASVDSLTQQHHEVSNTLARVGERSGTQARDLADRINALGARFSSALGPAEQARNQYNAQVVAQMHATARAEGTVPNNGAMDLGMLALLERVGRLENNLAAQTARMQSDRANLRSYFTNLQAQIKGNQSACFELIRAHAGAGAAAATAGTGSKKGAAAAAEAAAAATAATAAAASSFTELELPRFEGEPADGLPPASFDCPTSASDGGGGGSSDAFGSERGGAGLAMSPEVGAILAQLLAENAENRAANHALRALLLTGAGNESAFELHVRAARADQAERADQTRANLERAAEAAVASLALQHPQADPAHVAWLQQQESARTRSAIASALAGTPLEDSLSAALALSSQQPQQQQQQHAPGKEQQSNPGVSALHQAGAGGNRGASASPVPSRSPYYPVHAGFARGGGGFGFGGGGGGAGGGVGMAGPGFSAEMEAAATAAVMAAFAAHAASAPVSGPGPSAGSASQPGKHGSGGAVGGGGGGGSSSPFLTASTIAASMAAQAAQQAARQAQEVLASMHFLRDNAQFKEPSAPPPPAEPTSIESALDLGEPATLTGALGARRIAEKLKEQDRVVWRLDSTVQSLVNHLGDLSRSSGQNREANAANLERLAGEVGAMGSQFAALSRQFQAQHRVLDSRVSAARVETDQALSQVVEALTAVERRLDSKADLKLVLDKVSRSEYASALKRLRATDDDILSRSVPRDEYRSQLLEIKEVLSEDQRERVANITRIANELGKIVGDVNQKASKADLIDMATMLNNLPKVHDEVEHLKQFVAASLDARTSEILEVAIDRKQLKRSLGRLMRSLQEEVQSASMPVNCDACAMRTGVHSGTNCLSCAQQMKLHSRMAIYSGAGAGGAGPGATAGPVEHEVLASRGGGFMVTMASAAQASQIASTLGAARARTAGVAGTPGAGLGVSGMASASSSRPVTSEGWKSGGGGSASVLGTPALSRRPGSSIAASGRSFSRTSVLAPFADSPSSVAAGGESTYFPPAPGSLPHTPLAPVAHPSSGNSTPLALPLPLRSVTGGGTASGVGEVGSDGRVYHGRGSRTHRLVSTQRKSAARAAEEGDGTMKEEKVDGNASAGGSQSARVRR